MKTVFASIGFREVEVVLVADHLAAMQEKDGAKYNEYAKELKSKGEYVPLFIPEKKGDYCEYRDGLLINH